jgi:DHA2 family multidrug resistance protein
VAAGTLGALMATFDISIVNSSLPTIQGEIGASGTEGTWISTAYLVAEIVIIPLSGWLSRLFGLRTFLLLASGMFTVFSVVCAMSGSLAMMIVGRVGQGFTGGALIPTAMTIIATRLPRSKQPVGNAMFGATAILGPVIGPVLGGWLTENISWHYAFLINLPICAVLITLLLVAMPRERMRLDLIMEADWLGILGLAVGLGCLTIVLEEGQRELWLASPLIRLLSVCSVLGFASLLLGQMTAKHPVIRLSLLLDRQFSGVVVMSMAAAMVIYGTAYVIPQFLVVISGYNALQSGWIVALSGVPMMLMMPFTPWMLRNINIRVSVSFGMALLALSAFMETGITPLSAGDSFAVSQVLRGIGLICTMMFLNQAVIRSVPPEQASDAAGLYNASRNLGGSLALAAIAVIQDQRLWLHARRMEETLRANSPLVHGSLADQAKLFGGQDAALRMLESTIQIQALTMTYADLFWLLTVGVLVVMPLVFLLRPLPDSAAPAAAH